MTWGEILSIATIVWTIAWAIYSNHRDKQTNIKLEEIRKRNEAHNLLRQTKYTLEFKAYEELSMMLAKMVGDTSAFILEFTSVEEIDFGREKREEFFNKAAKNTAEFVDKLKGYDPFISTAIYNKFYDMRDLCAKGIKMFFPLEYDDLTEKEKKKLKQDALKIKDELINKHKQFNDELSVLIRARISGLLD